MALSEILYVEFDLRNDKIILELGTSTATGEGYVTITTPNNVVIAEITILPGLNNIWWGANPEFTDSTGHLYRGLWKFDWREGTSSSTTDQGVVTVNFDALNFPINTIETVDYDGNSITRDSIISESISMNLDCFSSELTVLDSTNYDVLSQSPTWLVPYTNAVYSPPNVAPQKEYVTVIGSAVITPVYTGTYTSYLSGALSYEWDFNVVYGDSVNPVTSLIILDTDANIGSNTNATFKVTSKIDGGTQLNVDCLTTSLCDVWECIRELNTRYMNLSCTNERLAKVEKSKLERAMQLVTLSEHATMCGETARATSYLDEIKTVTNCTNCS